MTITTFTTAREAFRVGVAVAATWVLATGCGSSPPSSLGADAAEAVDARPDAAVVDGPEPADADVASQDTGISFACTVEELQPIWECAQASCSDQVSLDAGVDPGALVACITSNCWMELLAVSPACKECLTAGVAGTLEEILAACSSISLGG